jgi:hypothetical protein
MARPDRHWQSLPGGFNALNTTHLFPTDNPYDIPCLAHSPSSALPDWLVPYRTRVRSAQGFAGGAVHFFVDDYRFEAVWRRPVQTLGYLEHFETLLTPDFSLFADWPRAMQLWNTYRSRWCGAYWQSLGFTVIPSVTWSTDDSFEFCFLGLPRRSLLAVSTVGTRRQPGSQYLFLRGFAAMVEHLEPSQVLCYGEPYAAMHGWAELRVYPDYWQGLGHTRRALARSKR